MNGTEAGNDFLSIDWRRIADAVAWYRSLGYVYRETDWIVSDAAIDTTLPPGVLNFRTRIGEREVGQLVGSAEQGFVQAMLDGRLPPGRYVSASPCFRNDVVDELHCREFVKVELIDTLRVDDPALETMMAQATALFDRMLRDAGKRRLLSRVAAGPGIDIELDGIEIGSYGIRHAAGFSWIYGTGLAEPRFSRALALCPPQVDRQPVFSGAP